MTSKSALYVERQTAMLDAAYIAVLDTYAILCRTGRQRLPGDTFTPVSSPRKYQSISNNDMRGA
jgi:hypothetical protein